MPKQRAQFGAGAYADLPDTFPSQFPRTIGPNAEKYLREVLESGLSSDMVGRFEKAFAEAHGVAHCMATAGCTPALAAMAAGLGEARGFVPGDEIIVSPITDYGTVQGIISEGYITVFADTRPGDINLSADTIRECITDRTRAVLCVHKTGLICDMDPIMELAAQHNLLVIEDSCQAVFGEYKGRLAGTLGHIGAFSFDSEKTMGSDMGGCLITNNDELDEAIRFVGQSRGGEMIEGFGRAHTRLGYGYRMPLCTGAVTLAQLEIVNENVVQRDVMIRLLMEKLGNIDGITPLTIPDYVTTYSCWMAGFNIDHTAFSCTTDEFANECAAAGIPGAGTGRYYLMPAALPFLTEKAEQGTYPYSSPPSSHSYTYRAEDCPNAHEFLETFIRWSTFCEKYETEHVELAVRIISDVADNNRR
jgi:perosamine synthetase